MQVVDAIWEMRNIGKRTAEITLSSAEDIALLRDSLAELESQYDYLCVKTCVGCSDVLFELPKQGFVFVEDQISLRYLVKDDSASPAVLKAEKLLDGRIGIEEITNDAQRVSEVLRIISEGKMFTTDRVALDPYLGLEKAGERYAKWCEDLRASGTRFNVYQVDAQEVGFGMFTKHDNTHYSGELGGMYPSHSEFAMYTPILSRILFKKLKEAGMKSFDTAVSTNNPSILKLHLSAGYQVRGITHVYVKHTRE